MILRGECPIANNKRFYINAKYKCKCPHCGDMFIYDFNLGYLSHPELNESHQLFLNVKNVEPYIQHMQY